MSGRRITVCGPQPQGSEQIGRLLARYGVTGRVGLVTAGWQEREGEDEALRATLGVEATNLRLHARAEELFSSSIRYGTADGLPGGEGRARDPELAEVYSERQERLRNMQVFYRLRLESTDDVVQAIGVRNVDAALIEEELAVSLERFRALDADHVARTSAVEAAFDNAHQPWNRPAVAAHRAELAAALEGAGALLIAGGHVASLMNRLRLFGVLDLIGPEVPVIAWSAGAMALTERVVCFHDFPPYGKDIAQVLGAGLGLVSGVVLMPDPTRRVRMDDVRGIARFAKRMAPARCLALDVGAEVSFEGNKIVSGQAFELTEDGSVDRDWRGGVA